MHMSQRRRMRRSFLPLFVMPRLRQNKTFQLNTPAKLNLSLEVLGRRPDGYHELRTIMSSIGLYDTLRLVPTDEPQIAFHLINHQFERSQDQKRVRQDIPADSENLVVRALELLRAATGTKLSSNHGMKVHLVKRIPSQAGLGGGSSDAAAALVLGNHAWDLGLGLSELCTLAERLGSDVPFFVHVNHGYLTNDSQGHRHHAAICEGRGERITPLNQVGGVPCVIVKPLMGLPTPKVFGVYSNLEKSPTRTSQSTEQVAQRLATADWRNLGEVMGNALQQAAFQIAPSLREIPKLLSKLPVIAHQLSGSGSAYFALCRSALVARRVAAILRAHDVGRLYVTTTC